MRYYLGSAELSFSSPVARARRFLIAENEVGKTGYTYGGTLPLPLKSQGGLDSRT